MEKKPENKTESKTEIINRLFKENGLLVEDYFQHSQYTILTRSGIEKIQYKNNVQVRFEVVTMTPSFCVVKAIATKQADGKQIIIETFGSAGHNANGEFQKGKQYQYLYYPELAEKRALSRAILKICNFYELGIFSEDESEDFKPKQESPAKSKLVPDQSALTNTAQQAAQQNVDSDLKALMDTLDGITTLYALGQYYKKYEKDWSGNAEFKSAVEKAKARILKTEPVITIEQKSRLLLVLNNSLVTAEEKAKVIDQLAEMKQSTAESKIDYWKKTVAEREKAKVAA